MEILIRNLSVEEINSALLRIKRQIKDDQAQLVTRVQEIIDNSKTTTITNESDYDDSSIKKDITNLYNTQTSLSNQVEKNSQNITENTELIQSLTNALSAISVFYEYDTNELIYIDKNGSINRFELRGTSYTFDWTDGVLTITDDLSGDETVIDLDDRYYTKSEIQSLILDLIPSQASSSNQLADKDFVNSSIETATATFRGTFTVLADLLAASGDKNDYAYLKTLDATSGLYSFDKYTYGTNGWEYAYTINSSGFTAEQLAALNSGITSSLVSKITDVHNSTITVCQGSTCMGSFTLNQASDYTLCLQEGGGSCLCRCCDSTNHSLFLLGSDRCCNATISQVNVNNKVYFNPSTGSLTACSFISGSTIYGPTYTEMYSASTPYIDFHFCNYCGDFSQRLIARCGRLDLTVNNGYCNTTATQSATYCFCSNGYLVAPTLCGTTAVRTPALYSSSLICGAGYFRQFGIYKPEVCTTSAGWCQRHFWAFADVTTLFDGSNHSGEAYTAGFVGNIFEHRNNGSAAENITQVVARIGYNCANRVLCYFPTMGICGFEPRVLYKCDEGKYYLGLFFNRNASAHCAVLEGMMQVGSCVFMSPTWFCSCTPDGCIACSCWAVCGSKASLSLNINSATVGCTYGLTLNCNNQLYCSSNIFSDGSTIYSNAFNGLFNRCLIDVTSEVCILGCNCDVVKCATFDKNFNMYHVFVCTKSAISSGGRFSNCIQLPQAVEKDYITISQMFNSATAERCGYIGSIWTTCGDSCQVCFVGFDGSSSTFPACSFCIRLDIPACASSPLISHSPSYPEAVLSDWEYKDSKCVTMVACCCLYGVRVNISNGNEGPLEGMLTIKSNCANVTPLTYCFKNIGTCYKVFEASTSPSFNTSTGCLHLQPYMYFDKCNDASYWFVFAVDAACYSGQVLCADLFQRRGSISVASNNINAFMAFDEDNLDATWKRYFVDLNSDNGSVTISSLSTCLITTHCMSTASMQRN